MTSPKLPEGVEKALSKFLHLHPSKPCLICDLRREIAAALEEAKADGMTWISGQPVADAQEAIARAAAIREGRDE